jgi:hypothetical protein
MASVTVPLRASRARERRASGSRALRGLGLAAGLAPLALGLAAWVYSLPRIQIDHLGQFGLPPALPPAWYAGAALLVAGASLQVAIGSRRWVFLVYLLALVVVLFGTVPAISAEPHYSWVYKHIGVTRFLELHHTPDPSIDIYNRWPGFFALTAVLGKVSGATNPVSYAGWAELFFTLLDALLLRAAMQRVVDSAGAADGAALLFVVANWVAQDYFSPQAVDFTLALAVVALLLALPAARPDAGRRATKFLTWAFAGQREQLPVAAGGPPRARVAIVLAVLALDAASIPTHQLSPYLLVLQVGALAALGLFRPRWIVLPMAAMTIAYLIPNLSYVDHNFGVFTSIDPFSNVQRSSLYISNPMPGKLFNQRAGELLSVIVWLGAALATARLTRRGLARRALPLVVLAVTPFALLLAQNYGGEAVLRVMLFSLPWCAGLMAWALTTIERPVTRVAATLALTGACAALFVPAFMGQEELNRIPSGEVRASDYFDSHARAGSTLLFSAPDFPGRYGPRYPETRGTMKDDDPTLLRSASFRHRQLGPRDVPAVAALIRHYSPHGYIVFSTTQNEYARIFQLTPPGALTNLENAIAGSPQFQLWYSNPDTRIYELVSR